MKEMIESELQAHKDVIEKTVEVLVPSIQRATEMVTGVLKSGNKVLICGNGGSAADSQHIAAELTGRYKSKRRGLPAIALTTDTSALTAIGNDFGFDEVFARQVEALAMDGDLLLAISTSGNSANVVSAIKSARESGCMVLGFSGNGGGVMNEMCDLNIIIPSTDTPRIQEMHMLIAHIICQGVDDLFV